MNEKRKKIIALNLLFIILFQILFNLNNSFGQDEETTQDDQDINVTLHGRLVTDSAEIVKPLLPLGTYDFWETPNLDVGTFSHDLTKFDFKKVQSVSYNNTNTTYISNVNEDFNATNSEIFNYTTSGPFDSNYELITNYSIYENETFDILDSEFSYGGDLEDTYEEDSNYLDLNTFEEILLNIDYSDRISTSSSGKTADVYENTPDLAQEFDGWGGNDDYWRCRYYQSTYNPPYSMNAKFDIYYQIELSNHTMRMINLGKDVKFDLQFRYWMYCRQSLGGDYNYYEYYLLDGDTQYFKSADLTNDQYYNDITTQFDIDINNVYNDGDKNWLRFGIGSYGYKPLNSFTGTIESRLYLELAHIDDTSHYTNITINKIRTEEKEENIIQSTLEMAYILDSSSPIVEMQLYNYDLYNWYGVHNLTRPDGTLQYLDLLLNSSFTPNLDYNELKIRFWQFDGTNDINIDHLYLHTYYKGQGAFDNINVTEFQYIILGLPYNQTIELGLQSSSLINNTYVSERYIFSTAELTYYDHISDISFPEQNITYLFNLTLNTTLVNLNFKTFFTSNFFRVPTEIDLEVNNNEVIDESYNSGYSSTTVYNELMEITADIPVYFEMNITTYFTFTLVLDVISKTYLKSVFELLSNHGFIIDKISFDENLDMKKVYLNNVDLTIGLENDCILDPGVLMVPSNIFIIEVILETNIYIELTHTLNNLGAGTSYLNLFGTTNFIYYNDISRFYDLDINLPINYIPMRANFNFSDLQYTAHYETNESEDIAGDYFETQSYGDEIILYEDNYNVSYGANQTKEFSNGANIPVDFSFENFTSDENIYDFGISPIGNGNFSYNYPGLNMYNDFPTNITEEDYENWAKNYNSSIVNSNYSGPGQYLGSYPLPSNYYRDFKYYNGYFYTLKYTDDKIYQFYLNWTYTGNSWVVPGLSYFPTGFMHNGSHWIVLDQQPNPGRLVVLNNDFTLNVSLSFTNWNSPFWGICRAEDGGYWGSTGGSIQYIYQNLTYVNSSFIFLSTEWGTGVQCFGLSNDTNYLYLTNSHNSGVNGVYKHYKNNRTYTGEYFQTTPEIAQQYIDGALVINNTLYAMSGASDGTIHAWNYGEYASFDNIPIEVGIYNKTIFNKSMDFQFLNDFIFDSYLGGPIFQKNFNISFDFSYRFINNTESSICEFLGSSLDLDGDLHEFSLEPFNHNFTLEDYVMTFLIQNGELRIYEWTYNITFNALPLFNMSFFLGLNPFLLNSFQFEYFNNANLNISNTQIIFGNLEFRIPFNLISGSDLPSFYSPSYKLGIFINMYYNIAGWGPFNTEASIYRTNVTSNDIFTTNISQYFWDYVNTHPGPDYIQSTFVKALITIEIVGIANLTVENITLRTYENYFLNTTQIYLNDNYVSYGQNGVILNFEIEDETPDQYILYYKAQGDINWNFISNGPIEENILYEIPIPPEILNITGVYIFNISFYDQAGNYETWLINNTLLDTLGFIVGYKNPIYIDEENSINIRISSPGLEFYEINYYNSTNYIEEYNNPSIPLNDYLFNFTLMRNESGTYNISINVIDVFNDTHNLNITELTVLKRGALLDVLNLKSSYYNYESLNLNFTLKDFESTQLSNLPINYTISKNGSSILESSNITNINGSIQLYYELNTSLEVGFYQLNFSFIQNNLRYLKTWQLISFEVLPSAISVVSENVSLRVNNYEVIDNNVIIYDFDYISDTIHDINISSIDNCTFDLMIELYLHFNQSYTYNQIFELEHIFRASSEISYFTYENAILQNIPNFDLYKYNDIISQNYNIIGNNFTVLDVIGETFLNLNLLNLKFSNLEESLNITQLTQIPRTDIDEVLFEEYYLAHTDFRYWYIQNDLTVLNIELNHTRTHEIINEFQMFNTTNKFYFQYDNLEFDVIIGNILYNPNWNIIYTIEENNGTYAKIKIDYQCDLDISNVLMVLDLEDDGLFMENWTLDGTQNYQDFKLLIPGLNFTTEKQTLYIEGISDVPYFEIEDYESDQGYNLITSDNEINFAGFIDIPKFSEIYYLRVNEEWDLFSYYYGDETYSIERLNDNLAKIEGPGFDPSIDDTYIHFITIPFSSVDFEEDGELLTITIESSFDVQFCKFLVLFDKAQTHTLEFLSNSGAGEISELSDSETEGYLSFIIDIIENGTTIIEIKINYATPGEILIQAIFIFSIGGGFIIAYYLYRRNEKFKAFIDSKVVKRVQEAIESRKKEQTIDQIVLSIKDGKLVLEEVK